MKLKRIMALVVAPLRDFATLGGTVNDGYWSNGKCSYTTRAIRNLRKSIASAMRKDGHEQ
jgi:hypothetical protein